LVDLTTTVENASLLQQSLLAYVTARSEKTTATVALKVREHWAAYIEYACEAFKTAEVKLSTDRTTAIEPEYKALYEDITANPDVVPVLRKAATSEELHLRLDNFYGLSDLSAATLLSESYRNALALSIYLSTALKSPNAGRFLILDDVTSSFDAGHQFHLMELLRTRIGTPANPNGLQVIILSHDGLLEKYFDAIATQTSWNHQKLHGLPPIGVVHTDRQGVDRIRDRAMEFLNSGNVASAEPLVRQYLEFSLLRVIKTIGINVPLDFAIRDDKKMVGNCLDAVKVAIDLHGKAGCLVLSQTQIDDLANIHCPAIIANWVSHYSTGVSASILPSIYVKAISVMDQFSDCFKYDCKCGSTPTRVFYRSLSAKRCTC
jgi:hypothetical protein